jgi:hypothetical protein
MAFTRAPAAALATRLAEPRRFIQVVAGPRQVGKTTLVQQVTSDANMPVRFASADVKSGRAREVQPGMAAFAAAFDPGRMLLVGGDGIPVEEFLERPVRTGSRDDALSGLASHASNAAAGVRRFAAAG